MISYDFIVLILCFTDMVYNKKKKKSYFMIFFVLKIINKPFMTWVLNALITSTMSFVQSP